MDDLKTNPDSTFIVIPVTISRETYRLLTMAGVKRGLSAEAFMSRRMSEFIAALKKEEDEDG